jgi:hypothetical protein
MPGFFSVADDVKIAGCEAYRQGALYGLDAASGAAVRALNPKPGEHVLDLCAAPGAAARSPSVPPRPVQYHRVSQVHATVDCTGCAL